MLSGGPLPPPLLLPLFPLPLLRGTPAGGPVQNGGGGGGSGRTGQRLKLEDRTRGARVEPFSRVPRGLDLEMHFRV